MNGAGPNFEAFAEMTLDYVDYTNPIAYPYGYFPAAQTYDDLTGPLYAYPKRRLTLMEKEIQEAFEASQKEQKTPDPFAPECSIPLPFQMGDEYGYYGPTSIWKRNERERHRVRCVNDGYEKLRNHLPLQDNLNDKRLSKVETLKLAIRYIRHLEKLLADADHLSVCDCNLHPKLSSSSGSD